MDCNRSRRRTRPRSCADRRAGATPSSVRPRSRQTPRSARIRRISRSFRLLLRLAGLTACNLTLRNSPYRRRIKRRVNATDPDKEIADNDFGAPFFLVAPNGSRNESRPECRALRRRTLFALSLQLDGAQQEGGEMGLVALVGALRSAARPRLLDMRDFVAFLVP